MKLPAKALWAAATLLLVPLITVPLVERFQRSVTDTQRASLASVAGRVAASLNDDRRLIDTFRDAGASSNGVPLFAWRLGGWVDIDGHDDDFNTAANEPRSFGADDTLLVNAPYSPDSLGLALETATDGINLFLHATVRDDRVVYRQVGSLSVHRNDHVQIAFVDHEGTYRRYTVAPQQPGPADVFRITSFSQGSRALRPDEDIEAYWLATSSGYNVEIRIPLSIMTTAFAISVSDVDSEAERNLLYSLGSASTTYVEDLGQVILPDPALDEMLARAAGDDYVLELTDPGGRVLARAGNIETAGGIWQDVKAPALPLPFYRTGPKTSEAQAPVLIDGAPVANIIARTSGAGMMRLINRHIETLAVLSLAFVIVAGTLLIVLATRISQRIRALRQTLARSVDPQGRVTTALSPAEDSDELGELHETFRQLTDRLQQYNRYLEQISRRLSHELRTPITVVSSSLDNLTMAERGDDDQDIYIERAREGISRLARILSSMAEATRLEASLNPEDIEYFDIAAVIDGCVKGYEIAYPAQSFEISIESEFDRVLGLPELISQLMDKLVGNAIEFAAAGTPVRVRLTLEEDHAVIRVINEGPALPADADHLFDSMISIREGDAGGEAHLGLGLYIARLIAEFHGGDITIENRADTSGVIATTRIPMMRITPLRAS